jgi:hypothetical protein
MRELKRNFEAMEREYKERTRNLKGEVEKNRADTDVLQKALAKEQETRVRVQGRVNEEFARLHQALSAVRFQLGQDKEASGTTAGSQMSKHLVGSPEAQASVASVEPPNLQGLPVVEPNAGAAGPLESASNGAAPGKGEANGGGLHPEVQKEKSSTQVEIKIPIFVPLQSDKEDDVVVQTTTGSVIAPVVGPTVSPASVIPGVGENLYAAMVAKERGEADDAKRATDAKLESQELDKIALRLGVEKVLVASDGNCVLSAVRATALKLGVDVRISVPEMRKWLVDMMRRSLDSPTGRGAMTLRESMIARAPGNLSKEAQGCWVEDMLACFGIDETFLEESAFLFLPEVLGCPILVVSATTTDLYGNCALLEGPPLVVFRNVAGRHVDGSGPIPQLRGRRTFRVGRQVILHRRGSSEGSTSLFISLDYFGDVFIHCGSPPSVDEASAWEKYFDMERCLPFPLESSQCFLGARVTVEVDNQQHMTRRQALSDGSRVEARSDYSDIRMVITDHDGEVWDIRPGSTSDAASLLAALRH